jgi:hypothetical protein
MIEAHIPIDRDLTIKGYKKAYGMQALRSGTSFYSWRAFIVYLPVAFADSFYGRPDLIGVHLYILVGLAVAASIYHYFDWLKKLSADARDTELHVVLDDEGVTIKNDHDRRIEWETYSYLKEYDDYFEITHSSGDISFLPKRNELAELIIFTKSKIPVREI